MTTRSTRKRTRKPRSNPRLQRELGAVPVDDSLATINWMVRALGQSAKDLDADATVKPQKKRGELIKLANAMAKLSDRARLYQAEQAVREHDQRIAEAKPGPTAEPVGPDAPDSPPAHRAPVGWRPGSNRGLRA